MWTDTLAQSAWGMVFVRAVGKAMESRFRHRPFPPTKILQGVEGLPGTAVLELGCGTGFSTISAAQFIGEHGSLVALDIVPDSVELVPTKVREAQLQNVSVLEGDALNAHLDDESFQTVLLFGVIPAPMLPLGRLLPEIRRILRPGGIMAVWPPVPGYLP